MIKIHNRIIKLLLILIIIQLELRGQDPQFSQFYANQLYLNPAFAGASVCPRVGVSFRDQWPSIPGTFVTYSASYDQHFNKLSGGLGIIFMGDRAGEGTINTNSLSAMYSYKLDVSRIFTIRTALQASYYQKSLNWDKLTFGDMIDPRYGFVYATDEARPGNVTSSYFDFSAGILGYSDRFFAGFAAHHLTEPEEGFISISKLPRKYTAHVGMNIDITKKSSMSPSQEDVFISPNILFQQQQNFQQLNYGFYINRYPFLGGLWFRQNFQNADALIFLFGVQQESFKFGYTYDLTVSKLTNVSGGSHEISFMYQFKCPEKKRKIRAIKCPSF